MTRKTAYHSFLHLAAVVSMPLMVVRKERWRNGGKSDRERKERAIGRCEERAMEGVRRE
jgi:hypothetical protein